MFKDKNFEGSTGFFPELFELIVIGLEVLVDLTFKAIGGIKEYRAKRFKNRKRSNNQQ
jgi:hypothetical protein